MLGTLTGYVRDILFPIHCVGCQVEGEWWCAPCRAAANVNNPACALHSSYQELSGVQAVFLYEDHSPLSRLIQFLKYRSAIETVSIFEKVWEGFLEKHNLPAADAVIPVPLHSRRERERGFNQAQLLAQALEQAATKLHIQLPPLATGLVRERHTPQQALLPAPERATNLAGAFAWASSAPAPTRVILLDDVHTTGATMQACARVLRAHGSREVWALTIARTE